MLARLLLFLATGCSALFSQEFLPTHRDNSVWTLTDWSIVERAQDQAFFVMREDLPTIPKVSRGGAVYQFDGQHIFIVETHNNVLRVIYGFPEMTLNGPQWFLRPYITLKGDYRYLGASDLHLILEHRVRPENKTKGKYLIESFDLTTEKSRTLLEEEFSPGLEAVGAVKDQIHTLFLSDGRILEVDPTFNSAKEVATRFWQSLSDKWVDFVKRFDGQNLPQPPIFQGKPFFTHDGDICIPMTIRETNVWTPDMGEALWSAASSEERERAIKQGLWPMKPEGYIGSDYIFTVLRYCPETRKTSILPGGYYEWLVERTPYVKQTHLKQALLAPLSFSEALGVYDRSF